MHKLILSLSILFIGCLSFGQNNINSPFSYFGLGEFGGMDHAALIGIGNSTITLQDSTLLNFYNPSSYNTLAKGQPLFSVGISSRLSNYTENGVKEFGSVTSIQHFAMAFPIAQHFGLAFGLKPYSRRGYEFSSRVKANNSDDSLYYNYSGTGGINEVFIGFSSNVLKYKGARISIGANAGYLFGTVENIRKSGLIESGIESAYEGGVNTRSIKASSFHYEIGARYSQKINDAHTIALSAVFDPLQNITGSYEEGLFYASNIDNVKSYDTLSFNDTLSGSVTNVPTYTVGLNYTLSLNNLMSEINSELSFHLSYAMSDWESYENRFIDDAASIFLNTYKVTFGIQYTPETKFIENKLKTKFFQRIRYRAGVYQYTLPYQTNGIQVSDFGTTFGFGVPIVVLNSLSSINLGFAIGNRGIGDEQSLKEQYYGINFGITIAPAADRWFVKRKLN